MADEIESGSATPAPADAVEDSKADENAPADIDEKAPDAEQPTESHEIEAPTVAELRAKWVCAHEALHKASADYDFACQEREYMLTAYLKAIAAERAAAEALDATRGKLAVPAAE